MDIPVLPGRFMALTRRRGGSGPISLLFSYNIEYLDRFGGKGTKVDRLFYINFCNPWPKKKHHKRRLTYLRTLMKYREVLKDGGNSGLKTDDDEPVFGSPFILPRRVSPYSGRRKIVHAGTGIGPEKMS